MRTFLRRAVQPEQSAHDVDLRHADQGPAFTASKFDVAAFHNREDAAAAIDSGDCFLRGAPPRISIRQFWRSAILKACGGRHFGFQSRRFTLHLFCLPPQTLRRLSKRRGVVAIINGKLMNPVRVTLGTGTRRLDVKYLADAALHYLNGFHPDSTITFRSVVCIT